MKDFQTLRAKFNQMSIAELRAIWQELDEIDVSDEVQPNSDYYDFPKRDDRNLVQGLISNIIKSKLLSILND